MVGPLGEGGLKPSEPLSKKTLFSLSKEKMDEKILNHSGLWRGYLRPLKNTSFSHALGEVLKKC